VSVTDRLILGAVEYLRVFENGQMHELIVDHEARQILEENKQLRNQDQDFGVWAAGIARFPSGHLEWWQKRNPDLGCPDPGIRDRAMSRFLHTPNGEMYRTRPKWLHGK
jgi:hypothetical protein